MGKYRGIMPPNAIKLFIQLFYSSRSTADNPNMNTMPVLPRAELFQLQKGFQSFLSLFELLKVYKSSAFFFLTTLNNTFKCKCFKVRNQRKGHWMKQLVLCLQGDCLSQSNRPAPDKAGNGGLGVEGWSNQQSPFSAVTHRPDLTKFLKKFSSDFGRNSLFLWQKRKQHTPCINF